MNSTLPQKALVLGGSGFVGHHLCAALSRQGWHVTVPTRRLPARSVQMLPGVSVVQADIHNAAQLRQLVQGHDAVINLVAILHGNAAAFEAAHVRLPKRIAQACHEAGVRRLIHVSALGADVNGPSLYQRSKARGEQLLQEAAQHHNLDLTLLRPSVIFGADDAFINLFARLQKIFPVMPLAGADAKFQPVWVGDVASAIVYALHQRHTIGQIYEACGKDVLRLRELVQLAGRFAGHERPVLALPHALGYAQALLMEWAPGPTLMSRDNLASMQVHNIASGQHEGLSALGIQHPKRLGDVFAAKHLG